MSDELVHRSATRRYTFGKLVFWADDGQIVILNTHTGRLRVRTVEYLKQHIRNAKQMCIRRNYSEGVAAQRDNRKRQIRFIQDAEACIAEAKHQGDPYDPVTRNFRERHRSNFNEAPQYHYGLRRMALSAADKMLLPKLPEGTNIRLDAPVPTLYTPPRKRTIISLPVYAQE